MFKKDEESNSRANDDFFFNSSNSEIKKVTADHDDILIEGVLYIADGIEAIVINTQQLASYVRYTKWHKYKNEYTKPPYVN